MVNSLKKPVEPVKIALVGNYIELEVAYYSVRESLCHAGLYNSCCVDIEWVHSEELEKSNSHNHLRDAQGILVPGGFGIRGIEGMIKAARYARENNIPYFGLCLGMQVMVIEFGRFVLQDQRANSSEFDPNTSNPVIDIMPDQISLHEKGGTMRLGNYPCQIKNGTLAAQNYSVDLVHERHRHRYEFNNLYRDQLEKAGMVYSGLSPDGQLVEICEIKDHPWMLGTQFHPEFLSRPNRPHPLFCGFVASAKKILREGSQPSLPLNQ
jgi:CTP synthase